MNCAKYVEVMVCIWFKRIEIAVEYVILDSKWKMPMLGLGTWTLHGAEGMAVLESAIDMGYRLFDTAQMYGNEPLIGKAVEKSGVPRSLFFLTSKLCSNSSTYQKARVAIDASLAALRTDYLDLMLIHGPYPQALEMYTALEEAHAEGKLKCIGISNFYSDDLSDFLTRCRLKPAVDQIEAHIYCSRKKLISYMRTVGVHMQAWSPLTSGKGNISKEPILIKMSEKYNRTPSQIALRFLVQNGFSIIPRSRNIAHLKENIEIFDFCLVDEDMRILSEFDRNTSFFRWNDKKESANYSKRQNKFYLNEHNDFN